MAFKPRRSTGRTKILKRRKEENRTDVPELTPEYLIDLAGRAGSLRELRLIWANTKDMGMLAPDIQHAILARAEYLKEIGQTQ